MLYHNGEVWATDRALRSLHHGFLLVDPWRQSPSYVHRLVKYARRYGLAIVDPAMDQGLIPHSEGFLPILTEALNTEGNSGLNKWQGLAQLLLLHSTLSTTVKSLHRFAEYNTYYTPHSCSIYESLAFPTTLPFCYSWLMFARRRAAPLPLTDTGDCDTRLQWISRLWKIHISRCVVVRFPSATHSHLQHSYQKYLPEALGKLQYMSRNVSTQQVFTGSLVHQPHSDWYADVQQLVYCNMMNTV